MMTKTNKYFIPIDRTTVRANPNAGKDYTEFPGNQTLTVHFTKQIPDDLEELFVITQMGFPDFGSEDDDITHGTWATANGSVIDAGEYLLGLDHDKYPCSIKKEHDTIRSYHGVHGKYLHSYTPTQVMCSNCGTTFLHTELQSDSHYDGYSGYLSMDDGCPSCGEWDCVELEYESINEATTT